MLSEGGKRDQLRLPGQLGNQEPAQGVADGSGNHFSEWTRIPLICSPQRSEISTSMVRQDDRRRVPLLDEHEVEHQASYPPVSVHEGMDPFEPRMVRCRVSHRMLRCFSSRTTPNLKVCLNP